MTYKIAYYFAPVLIGMSAIAFAGKPLPSMTSPIAKVTKAEPSTLMTTPHWYDRITLSGNVNVGGFASNHTPTTIGLIPSNVSSSPSATDINITFANLLAEEQLYDWLKASLNIAYQQRSSSFIRSPVGGGDNLIVDKAFVTFADACRTPVYLKVGRKFVDFGGLDNLSYLESPIQLLSLMRQTLVSLGVNWQGLDGSVYLFRGLNNTAHANTNNASVYGAALNYLKNEDNKGYNVGIGYISNIASALYTSSTVASGSTLSGGTYHHSVSALDVHAGFNLNAFDATVKYIGALQSFSVLDVPYTTNAGASFTGARPTGWNLNAGYKFDVLSHTTRFAMGYQASTQAVALGKVSGSATNTPAGIYGSSYAIGMPKSRYYANYSINMAKWSDIAFELARDGGYGSSNGGTGKSALTGVVTVLTHIG